MREQFEKLPEIANVLENEDTEWSDRTRRYVGYDADFANGAWYAFQEQQKKIDKLINAVSERSMYDKVSGSKVIFVDDIKELLK